MLLLLEKLIDVLNILFFITIFSSIMILFKIPRQKIIFKIIFSHIIFIKNKKQKTKKKIVFMFHLPYLMYLALLKIKTKTNFLIIILYILF